MYLNDIIPPSVDDAVSTFLQHKNLYMSNMGDLDKVYYDLIFTKLKCSLYASKLSTQTKTKEILNLTSDNLTQMFVTGFQSLFYNEVYNLQSVLSNRYQEEIETEKKRLRNKEKENNDRMEKMIAEDSIIKMKYSEVAKENIKIKLLLPSRPNVVPKKKQKIITGSIQKNVNRIKSDIKLKTQINYFKKMKKRTFRQPVSVDQFSVSTQNKFEVLPIEKISYNSYIQTDESYLIEPNELYTIRSLKTIAKKHNIEKDIEDIGRMKAEMSFKYGEISANYKKLKNTDSIGKKRAVHAKTLDEIKSLLNEVPKNNAYSSIIRNVEMDHLIKPALDILRESNKTLNPEEDFSDIEEQEYEGDYD